MAQASTSAVQLSYLEESTIGVVESGSPKLLRMTGEDLKFAFSRDTSKEINASRQTSDSVITDASASGGFKFEMQYREYDPFIEALLCGTFNSFGTGGVKSLSLTFAQGAGTITGSAGDFTGLVAGQYFRVDGSTSNDGVYRIGTAASGVLTVDAATPLLDDEGPTASVEISSTRVSCGTAALRTFSFEKAFTDVNQFFMHKGRAISQMSLEFSTGKFLTGNFGTLGKNATRAGATQFPGGAADAAEAYGIMSAVTGVGTILVRNSGGTSILGGAYVNSMKISIDGALREQKAVANLGAIGIGKGTFKIGGSLEVYLTDGSIYDAALANNTVSVAFPVYDALNNGYAFIFNNVKLAVPDVVAGSMDADVMLSTEFDAVAPDTSTDKMIIIDRFGASVAVAT